VIVPAVSCVPTAVLKQLLALYDGGGRVVFCETLPRFGSDLGSVDACVELLGRLAQAATTMNAEAEADMRSGDDLRDGMDEQARLDGLTAGFGIPRNVDRFGAEVWADKAVLLVPEQELGRLGRLMALRSGRFSIQASGVVPTLRQMVRDLDPVQVAFLMNDSGAPVDFELDVISEKSSVLERWDPADGKVTAMAAHVEVSEMTRVPMVLQGRESALLVLRPDGAGSREGPLGSPQGQTVVLADFRVPDRVEVAASFRIVDGDIEVSSGAGVPEVPCKLGEWSDLGLADFSGAVTYEFTFPVAAEYLDAALLLDLGTVYHAARVTLNDEELPLCLWAPYAVDVTGLLNAGENVLRVTVVNTLGNQAARASVVEEAKARGWFNGYYERALPMMQETLASGLIGPVRLCLLR